MQMGTDLGEWVLITYAQFNKQEKSNGSLWQELQLSVERMTEVTEDTFGFIGLLKSI